MINSGKKYKVKKLSPKSLHWKGVEEAIHRRTKKGYKKLSLLELYDVKWRDKPFPWSYHQFDKEKRWFFHGTTLTNIYGIIDSGFKISKVRTGRMLGNGVYATYHTHKSKLYGVDNYIISAMIYTPNTYVLHPGKSIDSSFIANAPNTYHAIEVRTGSIVKGYTMQNHEICVFDTRRIIPRFILKVQ